MDDMQKEIAELKEFIGDLKADRAATKEREAREAWTKYVSLSLVFIAVMGAMAGQWSGGYGGGAQMSQAQASDTWAEYQAKSIKQHLDQVTYLEMTQNGTPAEPALAKEVQKLKDDLSRYDKEKSDLAAAAKKLEATRDEDSKRGGYLGESLAIYSVAIALGSICMMTKKKALWYVSILMALAAVGLMLLGKYGPV